MRCNKMLVMLLLVVFNQVVFPQQNRIEYNNQQLFLSGANLAWISFAGDIGTELPNYDAFAEILLQMHDNGGNSLRWWLHTDGTLTPEFNSENFVVSPGSKTIEQLKNYLDIAWEREVGVILCLWSFDMLRSNKSSTILNRNRLLLEDTTYTRAYINNSLIPMVDELKGHPAIIAWEIFNEPEGMSNEFGWSGIGRVSMSTIQRFINLTAGAIHRTDPNALVTSGCWDFKAGTDIQFTAKISDRLISMNIAQKKEMEESFNQKYRLNLSADQIIEHFQKVELVANYNYYLDNRLIEAGGDTDGTLDFYSVHYYDHAGIGYSPFSRNATFWQLDKPVVIAEFHMKTTFGVPKEYLYQTLYSSGYAGALGWSYTDNQTTQVVDLLAGMKSIWDNYREYVEVNGDNGRWPKVSIISPVNNTSFPDNADVIIEVEATDEDGEIVLIEFFAGDKKIGEVTEQPFQIIWKPINSGIYSLTATATDDFGNRRISKKIQLTVGTPPMTRLEAERAVRTGSGMSIGSSPNASGGAYVNINTNASGTTITWTFNNFAGNGNFEIAFGYNLDYDTPKGQFINVNGTRIGEVMFDGPVKVWQEKTLNVDLVEGSNTIQMEMSWGYMFLDYLAVPTQVVTSVHEGIILPSSFALEQNYPNPFNPVTIIKYVIPNFKREILMQNNVQLKVYDIIGREITTLVNEVQSPGVYEVKFDASNLPSGVYIYSIKAGSFNASRKMMLIK